MAPALRPFVLRSVGALMLGPLCGLTSLALGAEPLPESPSGKSLVVPDATKSQGTVYYSLPGKERLMRFISDAPFEKINGVSNTIIGYTIAGPKDNPAQLQGGEWHLPVASIRTQNDERDSHLRGPEWLDAAKHPNIVFKLNAVKDVKETTPATAEGKMRMFTATLEGEMTLHGVTKPISIANAALRFRPSSDAMRMAVGEGDFLFISAKYEIALADYGIKHKMISGDKKVAEKIQLENTLYMSTVAPEDQPTKQKAETKPDGKDAKKPAPSAPQQMTPDMKPGATPKKPS